MPPQQQQQPQQNQNLMFPNPIPAKITAQQIPQLQQKYAEITTLIGNLEMQANNLSQNRAGQSDAVYAQRMRAIQEDLNSKREFAAKLVQILATLGARVPNLNSHQPELVDAPPTYHDLSGCCLFSPQQPQQIQTPIPANLTTQQIPQLQQKYAEITTLIGNLEMQATNLSQRIRAIQEDLNRKRDFAAKLVQIIATLGARVSNDSVPTAPAHWPQMLGPLKKNRFVNTYREFMRTRPINLWTDPNQMMVVDNKAVDIYALHCAVFNQGGLEKVVQNDSWAFVAGRMGFVQFPGSATDSEGPQSDPATAARISDIYNNYLYDFDQTYGLRHPEPGQETANQFSEVEVEEEDSEGKPTDIEEYSDKEDDDYLMLEVGPAIVVKNEDA